MAMTSVLPPHTGPKPPRGLERQSSKVYGLLRLLHNNYSYSTWFLFYFLLSALIIRITPSSYALVPIFVASGILLSRIAYASLVTFHVFPNPYLKDAIPYRVSAQLPDAEGNHYETGAREKVVAFHLGARVNHPLGVLEPNAKKMGDYLSDMLRELDSARATNGYLGGQIYSTYNNPGGSLETLLVSYFRSVEDVHNFAYSPLHREAWEWYNKLGHENNKHLGINHEIFEAAPGAWEAIYINQQPTLLGGAYAPRKGDKDIGGRQEDNFVSTLMDAKTGKYRTSAGRLGRDARSLHEKNQWEPPTVEYEKVRET